MADKPDPLPHPLDLYRLAVQHPLAEVAFIERCWSHFHGDASEPMLLREDFAGTCAVAAAWCASDPDRQAMAIELDEPTAQWAAERFDDPDLHILVADVMAVDEPAVDVTVALNFSTLIYHDRSALLAYLSHARRCLTPGGLLILDLFGGDTVAKPIVQRRSIDPDEGGFEPFDYVWDQGAVDPETRRIRCLIHFEWGDDRRLSDAFLYDWRLWEPAEVVEAAMEAGFAESALWVPAGGHGGRYEPAINPPAGPDWVGYVVCRAPG